MKLDYFQFAADNARLVFEAEKRYFDQRDNAMAESRAEQHDQDIHAKATELRSQMTYTDFMDALNNVSDETGNAILTAVLEYDNAELGNLVSRQIQAYFRRVAENDEPIPVFLRKQAD